MKLFKVLEGALTGEAGLIALGPVGAVILGYIKFMDQQAKPRWKKLPDNLQRVLSTYYRLDFSQVFYAEGINTLHGQAITFGNKIYFPSSLDLSSKTDLHWMLHELEHVSQYRAHGGIVPFLVKYLATGAVKIVEKRSLNIHDDIALEREADAKAQEILHSVIRDLEIIRAAGPSRP